MEIFNRSVSFLFIFLLTSSAVLADDRNEIKTGLFLDGYYTYDFNGTPGSRRDYITQALYDNAPNINLGLIETKYADDDFRFRLAGHAGDSVNANYAAEPHQWVRYIQESSVGMSLTKDLWIDLGIFPSHIGSESWISRDNPTYTRSLIAEFSPYYQEGAKLTYQVSPEVSTQLHILNGWQNISDERHPALGTQIAWKATPDLSFTQNTFLGEENYGSRFLHDFVINYAITPTVSFVHAFDVGVQKNAITSDSNVFWGTSSALKWQVSTPFSSSIRFENYSDPHSAIVTPVGSDSFRARGASLGVDYALSSQWMIRGEIKTLFSGGDIFSTHTGLSNSDTIGVVAINYSL